MTYEGHRAYRFDDFTLDVDRGVLLRGDTEIRLRPKSFEVLHYLVEHPGKLVSRDELLEAAWPGAVVTDDAVTQCLIEIRRALGDTSQQMIRTVPRRGYVFELPVESGAEPAVPGAPETMAARPGRVAVLSVLVAGFVAALWWSLASMLDEGTVPEIDIDIPPEQAIAVLPFEDMSPDQDQAYFADGVSEEILNTLARRGVIRVIARTSSFSFRGKDVDIPSIAEQLDVTHVLEGSIRKDGDAVRISVQLVDAESGGYLWTERFDRELTASSLFAIQSEIATSVTRSMPIDSAAESEARSRVPTANLAALEAYFEGRRLLESRDPVKIERAIGLFQESTQIDPAFAHAYVALADSYRLMNNYGNMSQDEADELGWQAIRLALELDEQLGEAYASLANLHRRNGDPDAAEAAFQRCFELNANYAPCYQWYGEFLAFEAGRADEGTEYARIAAALDPKSAIIVRDYGDTLAAAGRYEESIAQLDRAIALDPEFQPAYASKGMILDIDMGRIAEAIPMYLKSKSLSPTSPYPDLHLTFAYLDLGDVDAASRHLQSALELGPEITYSMIGLLAVQTYKGEYDAATETSKRILEKKPDSSGARRFLRDRLLASRQYDEALALYQAELASLFDDPETVVNESNYRPATDISHILVQMGRREDAEKLLMQVKSYLKQRSGPSSSGSRIELVKIHAISGNSAQAIDTLREAVDDGWRSVWWFELQHDSSLAVLHDEPAFEEILAKIRADMERQRRMLEQLIDVRAVTSPAPTRE